MADFPDKEYNPKWENRQKVIFGTLIFCACTIIYLLGWGKDIRLHETIATWTYILSGSVIASFVFGAAWEDVTKLRR